MKKSNLPLYCMYCSSKDVKFKGTDKQKRLVYQCADELCKGNNGFTEDALVRYEAKKRLEN